MAVDKNANTTSNKKGSPSDTGQEKAATKRGKSTMEFQKEEEIKDEFLNEGEEVPSHLKKGANPNRNTNKTKTSEPTYGNSK